MLIKNFLIILLGYMTFRDAKSFEVIPENGLLIDKFDKCNDTIDYRSPIKYHITPFSDITVRLTRCDGNYTNFYLKSRKPQIIDLSEYYNLTGGTCYIETINDNSLPTLIKRWYEYPSFLKYLAYVSLKAEEYEYF